MYTEMPQILLPLRWFPPHRLVHYEQAQYLYHLV